MPFREVRARATLPALLLPTLLGVLGPTAPVAAAEGSSCVGATAPAMALETLLHGRSAAVTHLWGRENLTMLPGDAGTPTGVMRVAYPAGSFSPGQSPVRGGAGFEYHGMPAGTRAACLSYKVRFPAGFDFVKGGKLPGLFAGDDPRGCIADDKVKGFSARLMWRSGGAGELYLYAPGREARCGISIGRGAWSFQPGVWTSITQKAVLNTPGRTDGSVEIWVDGRSVVKAEGLSLGAAPDVSIDGVLFSTFFGGGTSDWATPRDQAVDFAGFVLSEAKD